MKIIRSVCLFRTTSDSSDLEKTDFLSDRLAARGFEIQTKRVCYQDDRIGLHNEVNKGNGLHLSVGSLDMNRANDLYPEFISAENTGFNLDLTGEALSLSHVDLLKRIIQDRPEKCFNFSYVFNNAPSSPFFPSANFEEEGFSIGLQATNLSEGCTSLEDWFDRQKRVWNEICEVFSVDSDFLGIDSSIAPLFTGASSLVGFLTRLLGSWEQIVLSDTFTRITAFLKNENPMPVGLCGLMLPCLEDFELANLYEQGRFDIERNLFLSLHSGLGVDTFPLGINEEEITILNILKLVQSLAKKYRKPLSVRFISDGKSKIGSVTDFRNQYLRDVKMRALISKAPGGCS